MKTFPAVTPLLQELDAQGKAEFGEDWDTKVCEAIRDLRGRYTQLRDRNRKLIDYSSLAAQMAYAFVYVGANASCLLQVLEAGESALGRSILDKPEIKVTSWGGGPGSDLLALVALLRKTAPVSRPKKIKYRVLDKQPNWHEILQAVARLQVGTVEIEVSFQEVDVTIPEQWQGVSNADDDILLMNFFVSEVCSLRLAKSVFDCLKSSLASLSTGSFLIFNDSNFYTVHSYFDKLTEQIENLGVLVLENELLTVPADFDESFEQWMGRFDSVTPKLASKAAYRVLTKL